MSTDESAINLDPAILKRLDAFQLKHQFESRAATIKWILDWALEQDTAAVDHSG